MFIQLPNKLEVISVENVNSSRIIIEPCQSGYGITLGNALRRVLLSSLLGCAVVGIKINNNPSLHELSVLEHVKEDILNIILNLKNLRLKIVDGDKARLLLKAQGVKTVTAKDIVTPNNVTIMNPDLVIATLTHKDARMEIDILVNKGYGYLPADHRKLDDSEIGFIAMDAVFSPIKVVSYSIENIMIDERTSHDRLLLDIKTDGSLTPSEACEQASKILVDNFSVLCKQSDNAGSVGCEIDVVSSEVADKPSDSNININTDEQLVKKTRGRPKKNS